MQYYLSNDGTGPAFNVEHWVFTEKSGQRWHATLPVFTTMRAGEQRPMMYDAMGNPVSTNPITIHVPSDEENPGAYHCAALFENLLGERWEARSYPGGRTTVRRLNPRFDARRGSAAGDGTPPIQR